MYQILPILLFAFLTANESIMYLHTEGWQHSKRLKDEEFLNQMENEANQLDEKLGKLLNPD